MIKSLELSKQDSCLNKAAADEPIFVLRANDPVAAQAVRHWATMSVGVHEMPKIMEAFKAAELFERWYNEKHPMPAESLSGE